MASTPESAEMDAAGRDVWHAAGAVVVGLLAVGLWAQVIFPGLSVELGAPDGSVLRILTYLLPIVVAAAGIYVRSSTLLLLVFPLILLPGIAALPQPDRLFFFDAWSMLRVGATFTVYLAASTAWCSRSQIALAIEGEDRAIDPRGGEYRWFVRARAVPLLALFVVPTYGIFFDPAIVGAIARKFPEAEAAAQTFLSLVVFFVWCVIAYTMFLVPALNLEYDRRRLDRELQQIGASTESTQVAIRLGIWTAIVAVIITLLLIVF